MFLMLNAILAKDNEFQPDFLPGVNKSFSLVDDNLKLVIIPPPQLLKFRVIETDLRHNLSENFLSSLPLWWVPRARELGNSLMPYNLSDGEFRFIP